VKLLRVRTELTFSPAAAARIIRAGGTVAFPTETVYGLGADVFNVAAVGRIFEAKGRPADNPLIAHVGSLDQIPRLACEVPEAAQHLMNAFFPGPLTLVLRKSAEVPTLVTAGLDTIGVRMPGSELAREFLSRCGTPVAAPSANISGRPSPTTWQAVLEDLDGRIDCILQGDPTDIGLESTVVDCTSEPPAILRAGAVSVEDLRVVEAHVRVLGNDIVSAPTRSPGMRHRHYSPHAKVRLISSVSEIDPAQGAGFIGMDDPGESVKVKLLCGSLEEYARQVFEFFRECDRAGIRTIYCQAVPEAALGAALMDRLRRAAEG
jgi:L-threonylcarbamoyladenylate synthase